MRQIPNLITVVRILAVVPIVMCLMHHLLETALALFVMAAASDALDGFLAKRFGWQSVLGSILDPAADKLLLASVFIALAVLGLVPVWLTATVLARDLIIVVGAVAYRVGVGPLTAQPSAVSKVNTLCQAAFVLCVVARAQFSQPPNWVATGIGALAFTTTVVSGIDYVLTYGRRAAAPAHVGVHGAKS